MSTCNEATTTTMNTNFGTASIIKLNGSNYNVWRIRISGLLKSYDLMSIVDGSRVQPLTTNVDEWQKWDRDNNEALSILVQSMVDSELESVLGCQTAHQVWTKLECIYESVCGKQALCDQFMATHLQDNSPVKVMVKIMNITAQLRSMGEKIGEEMVIARVISTLINDDKFRDFREAWRFVETERRTTEYLLSRLKIWELEYQESVKNQKKSSFDGYKACQADGSKSKEEIKALKKKTKCHLCRKVGHWKLQCPEKNTEKDKANHQRRHY